MPSVVAVLGLVLVLGALVTVERGPNHSRELALIASLAAAGAAGRVLFAFIPNVQPLTMIVAVTGVCLGPRAGLATGATAALASNVFLGQGPWTPWQMLAWGLVGVTAGLIGPPLRNRYALAAFGVLWGFGFDWIMDVWSWAALGPSADASSFVAYASTGIWFDIAHATGNAIIALVAGPTLIRTIDRYAQKLHGHFVPLEHT
jgi:energy-coupling factor transport system substrate-specific component